MTVKELIDKLQIMPSDAVVVYEMCSECIDMEEDQVRLIRAEERRLCRRKRKVYSGCTETYNTYITYREDQWKGVEDQAEFVTVCHFPGN